MAKRFGVSRCPKYESNTPLSKPRYIFGVDRVWVAHAPGGEFVPSGPGFGGWSGGIAGDEPHPAARLTGKEPVRELFA